MIKFKNKITGRYYYLLAQRDMFNGYVLTIVRGGCHTNVVKRMGFDSSLAIQNEIDRLSKRRLQRGYSLIRD
jgi:hypothetical protein